MNDLLRKSLGGTGLSYVDLKKDVLRDVELGDVDLGDPIYNNEGQNLDAFFEEVNAIKKDMESVKELFMKLQKSHEESRTIHKATSMKELRHRMDHDIGQVLKSAKSIKAKLEDLDKENIANRKYPGCEAGTPTDRARTSTTHSLRKKLKDLMEEFQDLRSRIMNEYRETVERRYFTVTGVKPDEDTIEQIISTGQSENFLQRVIQEQGRGQVIETIKEIQERYDAVKEIEKNLIELHQVFLDMSVLVEAQGEQLNSIEHHVINSNAYIAKGKTDLHTAKKYQRNSRKYMCIAMIILLILVLTVVVPIIASFKN